MTSFAVLHTMPRATISAVWLAPIRNLNIIRKSSTALLGVPLYTTRLSPITRISTIGIRHGTSIAQKALETEKKDNCLGPNATFFNRTNELQSLSERFTNEPPSLTIILGPSSGKTALVRKVVNATPILKPVFIDLRVGTFDTVANTVTSLKRQFDTYFDNLKDALESVGAALPNVSGLSYMGAGLQLSPKSPPKVQFADLLDEIDSRLSSWDVLNGYNVPRPVLIVDEANRFMNLVRTEEGAAAVETFLQWLMVNTKQSLRFHVVLTSSDAFFQSWLAQRLTHFKTMVVGDLTKSEAERFFHDVLADTRFESVKQELSGKFDQVFDMTGGRILYIVDYLYEYRAAKLHGEDFKDDEKYSPFLQAYNSLREALDPVQLSKLSPQRAQAQFSRDQFIELMTLFVKSSDGFVLADDATNMFGAKTVASFIEHNIVHPRPPGDNNRDVPGSPKLRPILLPMGRPYLRAMKKLLENLEETNRK